jgi:aspartate racemase
MKTLGLIGGISWHSTIEYYRLINQKVAARLGGLHSAKLFLYSVDFQEVIPGDDAWPRISALFCDVAQRLEHAGAEGLLLCANTAHRLADDVQNQIGIPLIHIAEATGREIEKQKLSKVALLGTRFTMEQTFFRERLSRMGIEALIPDDSDRNFIHETIFGELTHGVIKPETRSAYLKIIDKLAERGARGIILGCTEIPLLIKAGDCALPLFDTTEIHATAAVDFML